MTRKCKAELIEKKVVEFEGHVETTEALIREIHVDLDRKAESDLVDMIRNDKISKGELAEYLPPYLQSESLKEFILQIVNEKIEIAQE